MPTSYPIPITRPRFRDKALAAHLAKPPRVEPGRRSKAEQHRIGRELKKKRRRFATVQRQFVRVPIANPQRAAEFLFARRTKDWLEVFLEILQEAHTARMRARAAMGEAVPHNRLH